MMWNGDRRQSLCIFALETQKKQQKENQNLNQGKKAGSTSTKDHQTNAAVMPSGNPLPERSKLQLLLGKLKRRDVHCMFSEPVMQKRWNIIMMSLKNQWILARLQQNSMEEATKHCKNLSMM